MSKAVLISIHPEWCGCAFRGEGCESNCREFWNRNKDLITSRRLRRRQGI